MKPIDTLEWPDHARLENLAEFFPLPQTVLLAWAGGTKGGGKKWGNITQNEMVMPDYLAKFTQPNINIGVATGEVSGWLADVESDTEYWELFLAANPAIADSLQTKGVRGGHLWIYLLPEADGTYKVPPGCKLRVGNRRVMEWRCGAGHQSIVCGQHPDGPGYTITNPRPILAIRFAKIKWPAGLKASTFDPATGEIFPERPPMPVEVLTTGPTLLTKSVVNLIVRGSVPPLTGQTHDYLWILASRIAGYQLDRAEFTRGQINEIFAEWFKRCYEKNVLRLVPVRRNGRNRKANTYQSYFEELLTALEKVEKPFCPEAPIVRCWRKVSHPAYIMPAACAAWANELPKMRRNLSLTTALFYELQSLVPGQDVWVAVRDLAELAGRKSQHMPAQWIKRVAKAQIIKLTKRGNRDVANKYRFVGIGKATATKALATV